MAGTNPISAVLIIVITIFLPPVGVWMIAGCGADLFVNICLTILGYFPGHIHAFYLEYVYFERRSQGQMGNLAVKRAPGVYSDNVNSGGRTTYGTMPT
ncbi:MAG: hypothetical protein L6R36_002053 [Xanthoria steineri]|nr:MAG: hypothetical protein L6R36_002053 [Xanthoria steineri]KAI4238971.1 MAG: hypothetical protein LQ349_000703 [Xanthoria aureola]